MFMQIYASLCFIVEAKKRDAMGVVAADLKLRHLAYFTSALGRFLPAP